MQSWLRRNWKLALNLFTLAALALLIYVSRRQIATTIKDLTHVNTWFLLLLIPIEVLNYHAQAKIYQRLFEIVGNKLSYRFLYRASLELNFVSHVFPSGGVAGISYFTLRMRKGKGIAGGKATLIHFMKIVMYFLAFEIILIFGAIVLALKGRVNNLVILAVGALATLLIVLSFGFLFIIGKSSRIDAFFTWLTRAVNRLIRIFRPESPETINIISAKNIFQDFHGTYLELKKNYSRLKSPFWYSFLADATEVAAVYVVYMAFGKYVNVGAVILAYGVANFAGLVSVLPGGVGIYEGLMTVVLASTGIPPGVSLPVTVMYRVLNTLIQIPPGYALYNNALRRGHVNKEDLTGGTARHG
ncbi:MAG TPA: lysylphosphatidylglycerol synthase transmembrane domain-containing protein [Candidatus Saccharimonadales bacterium]|nr:lysylphosphatidylglycerol synthase transmembrane domain-containing protein [Candidatus Saccharimonadales bacterium]